MKGKTVAEKSTGPDCMCKKKCMEKLDKLEQQVILRNLYNGRPKNEMDTFLCGLITRKNIAKHRTDSEIYSGSFEFYVLNGNCRVRVCRKAFCFSCHKL